MNALHLVEHCSLTLFLEAHLSISSVTLVSKREIGTFGWYPLFFLQSFILLSFLNYILKIKIKKQERKKKNIYEQMNKRNENKFVSLGLLV